MGTGMRLLLDTSTFIWLTGEPARLSTPAVEALNDPANELVLSHVSVWEICLKHLAGKLKLPEKPRSWISHQMTAWHLEAWPLDLESLFRTNELPPVHKDPFDRALAAQAWVHRLTLVSPDPCFAAFGSHVVW